MVGTANSVHVFVTIPWEFRAVRIVPEFNGMPDEVRQNQIAHTVIGCSITVHRRLGPGCFESAYAPCLAHELTRQGLCFDVDVAMDLVYEELTVTRA